MCRPKSKDAVNPRCRPNPPFNPRRPSDPPATPRTTPASPRPVASTSKSTDLSLNSTAASTTSSSSNGTFRAALPEKPILYSFSELSRATRNFLAPRIGDSSAWRCTVRDKPVVITRREAASSVASFPSLLADLCSVHHAGVLKLVGACSHGAHVYLVHDFQSGSNLADLLRPAFNPNFSPLSTWISRVRVALDVAKALEYVHHDIPTHYVHKHVKSSGILVTDPDLRAKVAHFGSTILTGEVSLRVQSPSGSEIVEERAVAAGRGLRRSSSKKISGTQGYMAPEYVSSGTLTRKGDVFAFGVVLLEILTGSEPVRFTRHRETKVIERVSLVEEARSVASDRGGLRRWVDPRLKDSFPVDSAEKMLDVGTACVDPDPGKRPDMRWVSGQLSRIWIKSKTWGETMQGTQGLTVSFEGR
ncbi:kinase and PP2C-like domain-containing protein [Nymphaea thermarum]|nr:kinase and PP2C-like domain-containing protein [Nymphaea thermarum]